MNFHKTSLRIATAESVGPGHPDKACDQVGDRILDKLLDGTRKRDGDPSAVRTAIEVQAKGSAVTVTGEIRVGEDVLADLDIAATVQSAWRDIGYADWERLQVVDRLETQSPEIAVMIDDGGAGDQGIMVGAAFTGTDDMMPPEFSMARAIVRRLNALSKNGGLPWLRTDVKSQVSIDANGNVASVIVSAQHDDNISLPELRSALFENAVVPILGDVDPSIVKINHKGTFIVGGAVADAGVLGRKIVVDAYGPTVPVGGGAYSGKDPTKVDRSAAYQARQIAKLALMEQYGDADSCVVSLAYGIGQHQPEALTAIVDGRHDISDWVRQRFGDLSPRAIQSRLALWDCMGWSYEETAKFGHYGDPRFPWEQPLID